MDHMVLGTATARTTVTIRMGWIVAVLLFVLGSWLIGQGLWIHVKAVAAQWLLQNAWHETLNTQQPIKPWPWADTWPVGRLIVPRLGINQIILADASGRSLAFGPGKVGNGMFSDAKNQSLILSGHRDTHFSFLRDVQHGDAMTLQTVQGDWLKYVVEETAVLDSQTDQLLRSPEEASLLLVTCYPFDALLPGGPLRYVVKARAVAPLALPPTATSAMPGDRSKGRGIRGTVPGKSDRHDRALSPLLKRDSPYT
jgi:sortase A